MTSTTLRLIEILSIYAEVESGEIKLNSKLYDDLGITGLVHTSLKLSIETAFKIRIEYEQIERCKSVKQLLGLINRKNTD